MEHISIDEGIQFVLFVMLVSSITNLARCLIL